MHIIKDNQMHWQSVAMGVNPFFKLKSSWCLVSTGVLQLHCPQPLSVGDEAHVSVRVNKILSGTCNHLPKTSQ